MIPLAYLLSFLAILYLICKNVIKTKVVVFSIFFTTLLFSVLPIKLYLDYLHFSSSCQHRPPIQIPPINDVDTIVFKKKFHDGYSLHFSPKYLDLNLDSYERIDEYSGKKPRYKICDGKTHRCKDKNNITSRYEFSVSYPSKNEHGVLQSNISIYDRENKKILFQVHEFVLKGFAAKYFGTFLSKRSNNGEFACGYLDNTIYLWRQSGHSQKYYETDTLVIKTIFPSLEID